MDDRRFDALARALGGASTRRGAIGALAALFAAAALDADAKRKRRKDRDDAPKSAGKRRNKKRCKPECTGNLSCVKGACVCETVSCGGACCSAGQVCQRGRCAGAGETFCHDLAEACGDGTPCCDGLQCGSGYGGGPVACWPVPGGDCERDEECAYGHHCADGACVMDPVCTPTTCAAEDASCGGIPDGCGGTLQCGSCGGAQTCGGAGTPGACGCAPVTCGTGKTQDPATCACECATGQTDCTGACADLQTDDANCGTCGNACGTGQGCCGGTCTNRQTDSANCGTCGNACTGSTSCLNGACCTITGSHLANYGSSGAGDGQFTFPRKIAFLADGRMLVADNDNARIQIWTQSGATWSYQASIPAGKYGGTCPNVTAGTAQTYKPFALSGDPLDAGAFYYVDQEGCFVMGCTGSGTTWTCTPAVTTVNFGLSSTYYYRLNDLAFDSAGRMFLVHASGDGEAVMLDRPAGGWSAQQANWPLAPTAVLFANSGTGAVDDPEGIAVGPDGLVYIGDTGDNRVTVWKETSPGTFTFDSQIGTSGSGVGNLKEPRGVTVRNDLVVVADRRNQRISLWKRVDGTWTNTATFPSPATSGSGAAQFNGPGFCALGPDGRFYVADANNYRVSVWNPVCQP